MHSEHLQNVRPGRVAAGWLVAVAVTSLVFLVLVAVAPLDSGQTRLEAFHTLVAVTLGFGAGGFFTGFRGMEAPALHGVAVGITSLVVWFVLNVLTVALAQAGAWYGLGPALAAAILFLQMAAAVIGALLGYNLALRGKPGLSE